MEEFIKALNNLRSNLFIESEYCDDEELIPKIEELSNYADIVRISSLNPLPIRLKRYNEAERLFLDEKLPAIALHGIRRTGKSTVMQQLACEYGDDSTLYLVIKEDCINVSSFTKIISDIHAVRKIGYLFIDEVTYINGLQEDMYSMLNVFQSIGIKLVMTGTLSHILDLARLKKSNYLKFVQVNFTPTLFTDLLEIGRVTSYEEFIKSNGCFIKTDNVLENSIADLEESMMRIGVFNNSPFAGFYEDNYRKIINSIAEAIMDFTFHSIIGKPTVFRYSNYSLSSNLIPNKSIIQCKKKEMDDVFNKLVDMMIINVIECKDENGVSTGTNFYFNSHTFYKDLIDRYDLTPSNQKLGVVFEATSVAQIKSYLDAEYESDVSYYKIRSNTGDVEVDFVVETNDYISLIEFKLNSGNRPNNFFKESIERYTSNKGKKVNRYLVYCTGKVDVNESSPYLRIQIDDFLKDIEKYL